jgi:hypothetical protein
MKLQYASFDEGRAVLLNNSKLKEIEEYHVVLRKEVMSIKLKKVKKHDSNECNHWRP